MGISVWQHECRIAKSNTAYMCLTIFVHLLHLFQTVSAYISLGENSEVKQCTMYLFPLQCEVGESIDKIIKK